MKMKRILLVKALLEQNLEKQILEALFEVNKVAVFTVENCTEAKKRIIKENFSLIIYNFRILEGCCIFMAARHAHGDDFFPELYLVDKVGLEELKFLLDHTSKNFKKEVLGKNVLRKPFSMDEFKKKVSEIED